MLSHKVLTRETLSQAVRYYNDGIDDYYANDGTDKEWQGKGAEKLGLTGSVDKEKFAELMGGKVTEDGAITRDATRLDAKSRVGIDLTFSAPKSVSMQALIGKDDEIIKAHDKAVTRALELAEERSQARKKVNGKTLVEKTGNLIIGKFRHETNREQDPQLHTHGVVMNLTQRSDGEWRALKNDEIIKSTKFLGAAYRAELAHELQKVGYKLRYEKDGMFELDHISDKQIEAFSQRSKQVEENLAEKGLTRETATAKEKQLATLMTRDQKSYVDKKELYKNWIEKSEDLEIDFSGAKKKKDLNIDDEEYKKIQKVADSENAKRSVRYAIAHLTERDAVITESQLIDVAVKHGTGRVRINAIEDRIKIEKENGFLVEGRKLYKTSTSFDNNDTIIKDRAGWIKALQEKGIDKQSAVSHVAKGIKEGRLVALDTKLTTKKAIVEERATLKLEREGRDAVSPILEASELEKKLKETTLNSGQKRASQMILGTKNRIVGVQGYAGTGKSYMLNETKKIAEQEGFRVRALAPYGSQVIALRELNVQANTLQSFINAKEKNIDEKTVIVIDEAGVVPTRIMQKTLQIAEKANARVVLVGDTEQTKAIESGKPFDQLQLNGMDTAEMDEIQRQKDEDLKKAVEHAIEGKLVESLSLATQVSEHKSDNKRYQQIAKDFTSLDSKEQESTIIVTGTNKARKKINSMIREEKGLSGAGEDQDVLVRRDTTKAERKVSDNYKINDVIQPERNYANGLEHGKLYEVVKKDTGNMLTVKNLETSEEITFSPSRMGHLSVYQKGEEEMSIGDGIRITRHNASLDIATGDRYKIKNISERHIVISNDEKEVKLERNSPLHIEHSYVYTVNRAQSMTSDRVLVEADTKSITTRKDAYYVAISRAKHVANIYTDSKAKLPKAIARELNKSSALEIIKHYIPKKKEKSLESDGRDMEK